MGRYDPRAIFEKEPAVIAGALKSILWVAVLLGLLTGLTDVQLAAIALVLELVLTLFTRQSVTPSAAPTLQLGTLVSNPDKPGGDTPPPDLIVARVEDVSTAPRTAPITPRVAQG